jgi:hypothetical protein
MDRDQVIQLFKSRANALEGTHSRGQDTVYLLAEVIASCGACLSKEDLDSLIQIGGTLVKYGDSLSRARADVAATMQDFHDSASSN